jgi:hypothetical protein
VLDVILTNIPHVIESIQCTVCIIDSDHHQLNIKVHIEHKLPYLRPRDVYNWKKANYEGMERDLVQIGLDGIIGNGILQNVTVNELWKTWQTQIKFIIDKYVPKVRIKHSTAPWVDAEVIHYSNMKNTARRKALQTKKIQHILCYKNLCYSIKQLVKRKYSDYMNNLTDNMKQNPKRFWSIMKLKNKKKRLPDMMYYDDLKVYTAQEKAIILNEYFRSVYIQDDNLYLPGLEPYTNNIMSEVEITSCAVRNELKSLPVSKAMGMDGIPNQFLKRYADIICSSITLLFNYSLHSGKFPNDWKVARVVPIYN